MHECLGPKWKTMSLARKTAKAQEPVVPSMFASPSIYDEQSRQAGGEKRNRVMTEYLSGKLCPLTPSQQPTDVAHLAVSHSAEVKSPEAGEERALVPVELFPAAKEKKESDGGGYCSVM